MSPDKFACEQARLHLEESRGSRMRKETLVCVLLPLALLAVKTVNGELARRLKTSLNVTNSLGNGYMLDCILIVLALWY